MDCKSFPTSGWVNPRFIYYGLWIDTVPMIPPSQSSVPALAMSIARQIPDPPGLRLAQRSCRLVKVGDDRTVVLTLVFDVEPKADYAPLVRPHPWARQWAS